MKKSRKKKVLTIVWRTPRIAAISYGGSYMGEVKLLTIGWTAEIYTGHRFHKFASEDFADPVAWLLKQNGVPENEINSAISSLLEEGE